MTGSAGQAAAPLPPYAGEPVRLPAPRRSDLLRDRVAVVTGGGRGLGRALACSLADAGAAVVVAGRHAEHLEETVELLNGRGANAAGSQPCDLADPAQAHDLVHRARAHFGHVDVLVNNAGMAAREVPGQGLPAGTFDRLFATNVRGVYFATLGAGRVLPPGGAVVNVTSVTAHVPDPELAAYAAGKAAVESLTRSFAVALAPAGIRVNAVAPGYLDTPLNRDRKADPHRAAAVVDRTPLGRWGLPADAADAVCFLACDRSAFVTGQVLVVDGGFSLTSHLCTAPGGGKDTGDRT
jgi:NAD(P)-dependent dehydrogenase (short-subunit alcohol dehydrogenase family)